VAAVIGNRIKNSVMPAGIKHALARTYAGLLENHTMQMAAALSYYFVLSFFPSLIFLSAAVSYLPVPDLFNQALTVMARFLPADSMGLVRRVLSDVITPNRGTFLSFGILGTLWAASGGPNWESSIAMAVNPYGRPVNVGGSHQDASRAQITIGGPSFFPLPGVLARTEKKPPGRSPQRNRMPPLVFSIVVTSGSSAAHSSRGAVYGGGENSTA
jgi:hypothetical protein